MSTSPSMSVPHLVISPDERDRNTPPAGSVSSAGGGTNSTPAAPYTGPRSATSASPPAPPSGSTGAAKRELPEDDEVDELRDDDPVPPPPPRPAVPTPAPTVVGPSPKPSGGGSKSRKSSCDLCHHRKIKCDQVRPSCSSCLRKGHPCHYSEETEANNPHARRAAAASTPSTDRPSARPSLGNTNGGSPAWMSSSSAHRSKPVAIVNGSNRSTSASAGSAERKRRLDRDRIVNGYGSSSDEGEGDTTRSKSVGATGGSTRGVDNDLADMLGDPKDEEVDELMESGDESSARGKKRDASVDDELSGELLELASAPPKKKKTKSAAPELPPPLPHRPSYVQRPRTTPRASHAVPPSAPLSSHSASSARHDSYSLPLITLMQSLPSTETQTILFNTLFQDPFLTEGISLLQPQFSEDFNQMMERRSNSRLREGDATTLANAFTFLAVALRVLPEETGKLLLASGSSASSNAPRSASRIIANQPSSSTDLTPLDQRYFELALLAAQIAEQRDAPSVMYVVHKFMLFRYATIGFRKDKVVLAGAWLAQAIKTAQALGMGKEWEGIPQGERELRRRVFWALFIADRQFAFDTAFPYTINDAHVGVHMPSPIAENELYKIPPEARVLPPHSTEAGPTSCTALFIHTHLARRLTMVLDAFACDGPSNTRHELVIRFDASLDGFQDALPPYLRLFPLTDTRFDSQHPYLPPHRVRLHSTLLGYRLGIHRSHLATYLQPSGTPGVRAVIAQVCLASIRCQKSAKMLDPKLSPRLFNPASVFEAAATLALIMYVERAVAGTAGGSSMTMSTEYLAMRAGVADGLELLDSLGSSSDGASYAHAAVRVLREVTAKVDAGPRVPPLDAGWSHKANGATNGDVRESSSPHHGSPSASAASSTQGIVNWLESWRTMGVNVDYVLREADWSSWEKIISGM